MNPAMFSVKQTGLGLKCDGSDRVGRGLSVVGMDGYGYSPKSCETQQPVKNKLLFDQASDFSSMSMSCVFCEK